MHRQGGGSGKLGRNYRYCEYRTAVRVPWSYQQATPAVETAGWQIAVGGVCKVSRGGPVTVLQIKDWLFNISSNLN